MNVFMNQQEVHATLKKILKKPFS